MSTDDYDPDDDYATDSEIYELHRTVEDLEARVEQLQGETDRLRRELHYERCHRLAERRGFEFDLGGYGQETSRAGFLKLTDEEHARYVATSELPADYLERF